MRKFTTMALTALLFCSSAAAAGFPNVAGQRLSDKQDVRLFDLAGGEPSLVLVAFSRDSGDQVRELARALRERYSEDRLRLVNVAVIASVPGLFRGMARSSLKKDIPEASHGRALVVVDDQQEEELRSGLGVGDDDAAYAVAIDGRGAASGTAVVRGPEDHAAVLELVGELLAVVGARD